MQLSLAMHPATAFAANTGRFLEGTFPRNGTVAHELADRILPEWFPPFLWALRRSFQTEGVPLRMEKAGMGERRDRERHAPAPDAC